LPSSSVHAGPHVPLGGVPQTEATHLKSGKMALFALGALFQVIMYLLIYCGCLKMPEEEDEDIISKNEIQIMCGRSNAAWLAVSDAMIVRGERSTEASSAGITVAFMERAYIIFWISKDLFWSWGTGDLVNKDQGGVGLIIFFESVALLFGTLSILIYVVTAYIYRRSMVRFIDCITTICWIAANYVWMSGEFFLRYVNLEYDDWTEGNDSPTRIAASCLFCFGILLQLYVILSILCPKLFRSLGGARGRSDSSGGGARIEMFNFGSAHSPSSHLVGYSPQRTSMAEDIDDEDQTILF